MKALEILEELIEQLDEAIYIEAYKIQISTANYQKYKEAIIELKENVILKEKNVII